LQWNTIVRAKSRGIRYYDLGGIDAVANPGVYHFKSGLGGDERCGVPAFDFLPTAALRGRAVLAAERAYRFATSRKNA
jgi:lipid II:glycine glycyltransferase (peptidoglycan interpeptide bridge formation enzyme)